MNNILITGANGQLGSELKSLTKNTAQEHFFYTDVQELDITDHSAVLQFIEINSIHMIINCAAYTSVDKAESAFEISAALNHLAVENFAKIAKEKALKLIHISTDYVFDGNKCTPYNETDTSNPQSVYGETKLAGELAMQAINPKNSIIIRTSWVYSSFGANFVKTMLRLASERATLGVISDQIGTPTYAGDLAKIILKILPKLNNEEVTVYHYSNEGVCSWYDFSKAIFEIKKINIQVNPITSAAYPTAAKRPFYSVLNKNKLKTKFNIEIPYWRDALKRCLESLE
ncbi:dTDP-4-dehydrorhamnose reductase [Polaribacter sp.]|nr:dTDP-4-dehydrorhamnose reductase [Polaribacter sp.]